MAGVAVSGVLWAIFQNNAGGAWDNAKKSFEAGVKIDGEMTYKGSDAHKAAVTGDTVGDPFKDTSGPSMNILIKLTCLVGLVIAPILAGSNHYDDPSDKIAIKINQKKDYKSKCCSKEEKKEITVFVDVNKLETDSSTVSILKIISISGKDTVANSELSLEGENLNIDSIVTYQKEKAMEMSNKLSEFKEDCKKPCCKGCKATDTFGLAIACPADHSCCNPNFK